MDFYRTDDDDILDILLREDDEEEKIETLSEHEILLRLGTIPDDVRLDNSYPGGQTALHIVVRSDLSWIIMEDVVRKLLRLGVDPEVKDKNGLTCTTITYSWSQHYAVKIIELWILTKYPRVWDYNFYKKYKEMIYRSGLYDYCLEITENYNRHCREAMRRFDEGFRF